MGEANKAEYHEGRLHKSALYKAAKDAQALYDLIADDEMLEDWVAENIRVATETLETVLKYVEYEKLFPAVPEPDPMINDENQKEENNYLSNEDKRFPTPMEAESGDGFVSRCLIDGNMKNRYSEQTDRFMACMLIWKEVGKPGSGEVDNPGEKFEDPMKVGEEELRDPAKPVLP
jgi:hypothetical protein